MPLRNPERFWARVEKTESCWWWRGIIGWHGYGQAKLVGATTHRAHRVAYEEVRGPIPKGMVLDHLCRNKACVNPDHLEVVTHAENNRRGVGLTANNIRKTHCLRGHEFTPENTYRDRKNSRLCRRCHCIRSKRFEDKKRDSATV